MTIYGSFSLVMQLSWLQGNRTPQNVFHVVLHKPDHHKETGDEHSVINGPANVLALVISCRCISDLVTKPHSPNQQRNVPG